MTQVRTISPRRAILAVTSGKGGVGKTSVVVNLATALARLGHRVGVLDADFGLGNIDVMLGLTPELHLGHHLAGDRTLDEVLLAGPLGITIVPAGSGIRELTALTREQWARLEAVIRRISQDLDFLLIDTAAGISNNVVDLLLLAERVVIVTSFEPTAVVDAYAVVKILTAADRSREIGVVVNDARDADEAGQVFRQLDIASGQFLKRGLRFYGYVVHDQSVRDAVLGQRPVVEHVPQAPASRCFRILASRLAGLAPIGGAGPRAARSDAGVETTALGNGEASWCA